ncbi:MFS transporter [Winogradskya humida]|uniref:MFS transporter n=1 Tax=Winogradskya humida TaxID=113566 RepID=A0ABQ3ZMV3_9ACTN|nr:MFS transporter [Actinoplanes humidus]GIE19829.1 MFS transporter [Actinoplanes humidus]
MRVPPLGRDAWLALGMNALSCLGSGLTMPFLLVYLHAVRDLPLGTAGAVLAVSGVAGLVVVPLTGPLVDRAGARPAFVGGLLVGGAGIALFTVATSLGWALLAAVVYGFSGGLTWNSFASLLAQLVPASSRGAVFALRYTSANAAFGAGALIAGFVTVGSTAGPYVAILLVDAVSYVALAAAMLLVPAPVVTSTDTGGGYRVVLRDRALLRVLVVNTLLTVFALAQPSAIFTAWVTGPGGQSSRVAGIAFAVNIAVLLACQLPVLAWARGRSRLRVAAASAVVFAGAWVLLAFGAGHAALIVAALGVFAVGETLLSPTLPALVNDLAPDELRGRYNAALALSQQSGPVLAPLLGGLALGRGLGVPYVLLLAAVCLATAALASTIRVYEEVS